MINCNVLVDRLYKSNLECHRLEERLRSSEQAVSRWLQAVVDTDREINELFVENTRLKEQADKAEKELKVVRDQVEKKDLESARTIKELATTVVELRVRLGNCKFWVTCYQPIPAMALIRKEVSSV